MNNKLNTIVAKLSAAAMIGSMFVTASPALAASSYIDTAVDTMSAADGLHVHTQLATAVTHTVSFNLNGALTDGSTITFADQAVAKINFTGATLVGSTGSCTVDTLVGAAGSFTLDVNDGADCTGADTIAFSLDGASNAGATVGSHLFYITSNGADDINGAYAVAISTNDQITVSAIVDPSITFEVWAEAACDTTPDVDYDVSLGNLTAGGALRNGDEYVCTLLSTNATNGAVVTVKSDSAVAGADGFLTSSSVTTDRIVPAPIGALDSGFGWGLCVNHVDTTAADPDSHLETTGFSATTTLSSTDGAGANETATGICTSTLADSDIETSLDGTAQTIETTAGEGVAEGIGQIMVKARVSGTQPAHTDYTATLTFVATGTF